MMDRRLNRVMGRVAACSAAAVLACITLTYAGGCESYDNGTRRTNTSRTVETPSERTTTTTTTEKKVEDYPR